MANAFYAAFGACKRRGNSSAYCYRKVKRALERGTSRPRKKKRRRGRSFVRHKGMARKGWVCRRKTRVWSAALGKRVLRCTGGYKPRRGR